MSKYVKTLVIDVSYIARSIINVERAFAIAYKGNATILHEHDEYFKVANPKHQFKKPSIIRVKKFINDKIHKVPLTRENVFKRDNWECVYCGSTTRKTLTLDHVIPQSKGGENSWENLVTACKKCNNEKDCLTLEEYGKSIPKPYRPHYLMLLKQVHSLPEEWKDYLIFK